MAQTSADKGRNKLYRARPVNITVRGFITASSGTPTTSPTPFSLSLTEVTSIRESTNASVAVARGVVASIIQPWYFQPIQVDITGKSYMGALDRNSLNVNVDSDVDKLLALRDHINTSFTQTGTIKDLIGTVEYGKANPLPNRGVNQLLTGQFDEITIEESDNEPYIQTYTIKFIGDLSGQTSVDQGAKAGSIDKQTTVKQSATAPITSKGLPK